MADQKFSKDEVEKLRRRCEYEDKLLSSRTGIVLTFNGLAAIAIGISTIALPVRILIAVVVIVIDAIWLTCSIEAAMYIKQLLKRIDGSDFTPPDEEIRQEMKEKWRQKGWPGVGSTIFIGIIVPSLLLAAWIGGLVWAAFSLLFKQGLNWIFN